MVAETKQNGSTGAAAAAASASAKKKKSRKPAPAAFVDTSKYDNFCKDNNLPITVQFNPKKGRHAVAAQDLEVGTIVCNERATSLVISTPGTSDYCHHCVQPLKKAALLGHQVSCGKCGKATYCSAQCQKTDAPRHAFECPIVPKLAEIAGKHELNVDLLRLILSLITRRALEQKRERLAAKGAEFKDEPGPPVGPFFCVEDLPVHRDAFDKTWLKAVTGAAKSFQEILPAELATSEDDIIDYACRINSNAHSLSDEEGVTSDTAFGLFPVGSLFFRHSCAPNCHFVGGYGILTYRTSRPIKAGEELFVSHVELFQSRDIRKGELKVTKHITCHCSRCDVPMRKSVDRFLDGVLCRDCGTGVYLSEKYLSAEEAEKLAEAKGSNKKGKKKSATAAVTEEGEAKEEGAEDAAPVPKAHCDVCGHGIPQREVDGLRQTSLEQFREIFRFSIQPNQRNNYAQVANMFSRFLLMFGRGGKILHPWNAVLHNARLTLLTALTQLGDNAGALGVGKETLDVWEKSKVVPGARQEYVDLLLAIADTLEKLAKAKAGSAPEGGAAQKKKVGSAAATEALARSLSREAKEYYRRALEVGKQALGEDHKKVAEIKKKLKI
ncbi:hypothetical protein HK097_011549 [Rhizophlyctis rosea]|uniref:SET domain-containing protein n=1 Tax=Rhizophlyctis rosea TaxID=64517 RepID=A0AAD5S8X9_9FUNG|nr:hypothetical protein HK097_011549 [Rhizophlyctis rosea]